MMRDLLRIQTITIDRDDAVHRQVALDTIVKTSHPIEQSHLVLSDHPSARASFVTTLVISSLVATTDGI